MKTYDRPFLVTSPSFQVSITNQNQSGFSGALPSEETSGAAFVARVGLYLGGCFDPSPEERANLLELAALCEQSRAVAAFLEDRPCEYITPGIVEQCRELAREERAPGGAVLASDFFSHTWAKRRALVGEWLGEGSLGMLYAYRGLGKTWMAYDLALSVALGSQGGDFLGWPVEGEGRRVLYVDGEMMPSEIRDRFLSLLQGRGASLPPGLSILSRMAQPGEPGALLSSLSTPEGRAQVERAAKGCALVILDNARTLGLGGAEENESSQWLAAQEWLLSLKRLGCAVLFVHHAGKGGGQRGTSAREDACDYVLGLHAPERYPGEERTQGARCVVRFEKSRGATLAELGARDARLLPGERGGVVWAWEPANDDRIFSQQRRGRHIDKAALAEYRRLRDQEGLSVRAASEAVGVPRSTLQRWDRDTPQNASPPPDPVALSRVPLAHPLKGGVGHGTTDCTGATGGPSGPSEPVGQWDNSKNNNLPNKLGQVPATVGQVGHWPETSFSLGALPRPTKFLDGVSAPVVVLAPSGTREPESI
jgi:AAA domain